MTDQRNVEEAMEGLDLPMSYPESVKQIAEGSKFVATLSSGLLAFTAAFAKDFGDPNHVSCTLIGAWWAYGISIFFSVWTFFAALGTLAEIDGGTSYDATTTANTKIPGGLMIVSFVAGCALTAISAAY